MYDTFPDFDTCIALIRSGDAHSSEQGYWWLEERAGQYTDRLVPLVIAEPNPFIRAFFVELLGDTKDPAVIPVLVAELLHCERQVREWAVSSLEKMGTEQAKALAQEYKNAHPEEYTDASLSVSGGSRQGRGITSHCTERHPPPVACAGSGAFTRRLSPVSLTVIPLIYTCLSRRLQDMRTCSRYLPFLLFAVSIGVFLCFGCAAQSHPKPQQFADAYKALMISYRDQMKVLTARPMPPASMPKAQKRAVLAQQIDDLADAYTNYANRMDGLQAPPSMREMQSTTEAFFKVSAEDNHRWAEAIRHGDSKTSSQVEHQGEINELAAMKDMQRALKQMGVTAPKLQSVIDTQQQSVNK